MKKTIVYTTTIGLLCLSSCITDGDFLEYDESTIYDAAAVKENYDRTTNFVTNIYSYLPTDFYTVDGAMRSSACDESEYVWPTNNIHIMTNGEWSPRKTVDSGWSNYYKGIRAVNLYLEQFNASTFDYLKYNQDYQDRMTRYRNYEYEVRFLRAYFHFELLRRYGDIPLEDHTLKEEEVNNVIQTPFDDVVQFIVDECDSIKNHLQPEYGGIFNGEVSRIRKAAAYALKARVLLYAASPLHNPSNDPDRWIRAAQASADILKAVDNKEIGFMAVALPAYSALLTSGNYTNAEVILATRTGNSGNLEHNNFPIGIEGGNSGNCPTHNLVEKYGVTEAELTKANPFSGKDFRLAFNVLLNGTWLGQQQAIELWEGGLNGLPKAGASNTGYYMKKFVDATISFKPGGMSTSEHSFILFRYAEVYLNYAEAVNEVLGPETAPDFYNKTALQVANVVRGRRNLPANSTYAAGRFNQDTFRDELRDERWRELAFEDHRFWDIRRWKIGAETQRDIKRLRIRLENPANPTGQKLYSVEVDKNARYWDDKMYLYPIPQDEIDKNHNLKQNPRW